MDKKDESCEKLVIAKIGGPLVLFYRAPASAVHGGERMFDKIRLQS